MHLSLTFLFLLTTPFPSIYATNDETKNSTKPTNHVISLTSLKSTSPPIKPTTQTRTTPPKISSVTQTLTSFTKPALTSNAEKTSEDKSSSNSLVTVVITKGCTVNTTSVKETDVVNLEPGSPLVMTHHINLVPGPCTGGCEVEIATLMGRVELLEKEMSALKKKCSLCSEGQCPNNCSSQGKCEGGKCKCHHGFSGPDCSAASCSSSCSRNAKCENGKCVCKAGFTGIDCTKGINKESKVTTITVSSESGTATNNILSENQTDKTEKKTNEKEQQD
ncbi:tenascin-like, partial [Trichomycterus rosablanca]|uniref:tenascin-like n=1 Tax=Trichomycterus rosablanca TaxID=2290929 RepID=UPI002F35F10F